MPQLRHPFSFTRPRRWWHKEKALVQGRGGGVTAEASGDFSPRSKLEHEGRRRERLGLRRASPLALGIKERSGYAPLESLKAEAKLIEKEADATQRLRECPSAPSNASRPRHLGDARRADAGHHRPMIGDLRRAANPEPLKYKELPRAAKPPQHVKYVSEARAVARTNANIADRLPKGTPTREALKVSMRLSGPSEAKELGELSKMLAPSPMGRSRREDHGVLAKKAAAMAEAHVSRAPMPALPHTAYKMPQCHLASREFPVEETDPSALAGC